MGKSIFDEMILPKQKGVTGVYVGKGKHRKKITNFSQIKVPKPGKASTSQKLAQGIGTAIL